MRLIAAGRASEVLDLGDGLVFRRFKDGGHPAREAAVMQHARARGFPVPHVIEVRDDGLVLERIDGPTMLEDLQQRPWRAFRDAQALARLHSCLHEIPFEGNGLIHLDLHPGNVLLSPRGPVVID
jgi:tRNA A-37 threonylcarbamoyl transferase component Bud32